MLFRISLNKTIKNLNILLRFLNTSGTEVERELDWESGHRNYSPKYYS